MISCHLHCFELLGDLVCSLLLLLLLYSANDALRPKERHMTSSLAVSRFTKCHAGKYPGILALLKTYFIF